MNQLSLERRTLILRCLTDGVSIRASSRITGHARNTISKFLAEVGDACERYQADALKGLRCRYLQTDEIWTFCGCKEKALKRGKQGDGSVWTWVALCRDTKIVPAWLVGTRTAECASGFMHDLASRLANRRPHLTSDGYKPYIEAVEDAFGSDVDYGMLVKQYESNRYVGSLKEAIAGTPDPALISTSHVERQNLTMRMSMRRFTRRTNGFSKKLLNLKRAVALHFMHYNFVRIHQSLRITPAMAAGVSSTLWEMENIVRLVSN